MEPEEIFTHANETLKAIMEGLEPRSDDRIISICGCGAQPLALLENVKYGKVLAVDNEPRQFKQCRKAMEKMIRLDFEGLNKMDISPRDKGYFSRRKMRRIANNLENLEFREMDVSKSPDLKKTFTKGYFSNANVNLKYFHKLFVPGSLIYVTYSTMNIPLNLDKFLDNRSEQWKCDVRKLYEIDRKKTLRACELEFTVNPGYYDPEIGRSYSMDWTPCVFRRL